jgi:hypothetical protein
MSKKIIFLVLLVCFLSFVFVSCGDDTSRLTGTWEGELIIGEHFRRDIKMELFSDGTGVIDGNTYTWVAENNRFRITRSTFGFGEAQGMVADYRLSGSNLTLTYQDETYKLRKKR